MHDRGVVDAAPGLYFVGLFFLYAANSSLIGGVGRDAERIAKQIAQGTPVELSAVVPSRR
jgi:putative flavoprotein involved in K+ transport